MRRVFSLFAILTLAFPFLSGCGGGNDTASSPEEQQQRLEQTESAMQQGMEAMKDVKK